MYVSSVSFLTANSIFFHLHSKKRKQADHRKHRWNSVFADYDCAWIADDSLTIIPYKMLSETIFSQILIKITVQMINEKTILNSFVAFV